MPQMLSAILIASAMVLSPWHTTAAASTAPTEATSSVAAASNQPALRPGAAAGIREAQGIESGSYWREAGLAIGAFVVIWLLAGIDGSDDPTTTTGT